MSQVEVTLKSGKTIKVRTDEVEGLRKGGFLGTSKAKKKEEKQETKTKEEKGTGTITKANFKK